MYLMTFKGLCYSEINVRIPSSFEGKDKLLKKKKSQRFKNRLKKKSTF